MSKIYTKGGDKGTTSLFDRVRVSKDDIRVESYGTVDELGAALGVAKNYTDEGMRKEIEDIQHKLFTVAASLATKDQSKVPVKITEEDISRLEQLIDKYMDAVVPRSDFILNGSTKAAGFLHLARTISRRAERRAISLSAQDEVCPLVIKYLNRLSDAIYAMARYTEEGEASVSY
ncbi:MAG: cob(I)yrinic acid a,c-diamide adenosyltransferase [Tissierellia bacterium]|jgi:cob(I)alamin adenosyltransferase|nr:cob(I)yrinic acid a,c-diamide adenosyltransferase [Bacillota bacterium]NLL23479.1 cob(I)yrinic acid a,c-diamide adenosyltransferase [Tissierellia bacterium]